jgi:hypothetical protein
MKIEIKHRINNSVLFSHDAEENSLKITLLMALKARADLRGADLYGANLSGADLYGADLYGADLSGADLRGADLSGADLSGANLSRADLYGKKLSGGRPFFQLGPIGSRSDYLLAFTTESGIQLKAGCFSGSIDEFELALDAEHGKNEHGMEYRAALTLIRQHAALWPAIIETEEVTA